MTTSTYPTTADAINSTDDPALVTEAIADAVNAVQADLIAIGATSASRVARDIATASFTSGTGVKNTDVYDKTYSLDTTTAGSAIVSLLGPLDGSTYEAVAARTTQATDCISVRVPAGWSVKIALTTSTAVAVWVIL